MKKSKYILVILTMLFASIIILSAATKENYDIKQTGDWVAPKSADNLKNPFADDINAAKLGKKIYNQMCAICHGNKGAGDGIAGMALNPKPTDFTLEKIQDQTDGALFWKLTEGRVPMASYKKTLNETKRWQLINYIRELKK